MENGSIEYEMIKKMYIANKFIEFFKNVDEFDINLVSSVLEYLESNRQNKPDKLIKA